MKAEPNSISATEVRQLVKRFTDKSSVLPFLIFFTDIVIYFALVGLIIWVDNHFIKFILSLFCGLSIGLLFIVGHDCCHQSFTKNKALNELLGKIAFSPSLHNYSLWELGHNQTHHAFTNLKGYDYVYEPLSVNEFGELSSSRQILYKIYRSTIGHGLYYGVEIWFRKVFYPNKSTPNLTNKRAYWLDLLPLVGYVVFMIFLIKIGSRYVVQDYSINLFFALVMPFLVWNWLMGFVIYQHHTTPYNKWYKDKIEWHYFEVQIAESTHVKFPQPLSFLLHNIMEHTAHHSNMGIPLYQLHGAQKAIEYRFEDKVQVIKWSWNFYRNSIKTCKLYDFENHKWVGF